MDRALVLLGVATATFLTVTTSGAGPWAGLPAPAALGESGYALILEFETGGAAGYVQHPEWPGAASGVTVGVGYDCGYNARWVICSDWAGLGERPANRLAGTSGVRGEPARTRVNDVRDILVPWRTALGVFDRVTVARFYALAQRAFPGFDDLRANARAALVSLVFNRGSSMIGENRREMRELREAVARGDYAAMAMANRRSERVWRGTAIERGMVRRREAEARLMETP